MSTQTLAAAVLDAARNKRLKIVTAESCTGGMIAAALTDIAGSSDVVDRGFVTYSNEAKMEMLDVLPETLAAHGAVSFETAHEMAHGALARSEADVAVSVTGIAGPGGGSDEKPVGLVWFGVATSAGLVETGSMRFGDIGRGKVRNAATRHALTLLQDAIATF
ncbi:MAG: CinA family protein [Rhizobiaceae bacterium]